MGQAARVEVTRRRSEGVFSANFGVIKSNNVGEGGERREVALGAREGVNEEDGRCFVEDDEPSVGGAAAALAVRSFWKVEEVDSAVGEVEEGAVGLVGLGLGEHQPGELRREMVRGFGDGGSPTVTHNSESEVVGVDCELFGD